MSKVYVVYWEFGEYPEEYMNNNVAVFSTREKAEAYVQSQEKPDDYTIEEFELDKLPEN